MLKVLLLVCWDRWPLETLTTELNVSLVVTGRAGRTVQTPGTTQHSLSLTTSLLLRFYNILHSLGIFSYATILINYIILFFIIKKTTFEDVYAESYLCSSELTLGLGGGGGGQKSVSYPGQGGARVNDPSEMFCPTLSVSHSATTSSLSNGTWDEMTATLCIKAPVYPENHVEGWDEVWHWQSDVGGGS